MNFTNKNILRTNAMDGENAAYIFVITICCAIAIIVLVYNYLTARTTDGNSLNYWAIWIFIPIVFFGTDIFLFELRGKEIICVYNNNTLRILHKGGIFTKKWDFKFEEILDVKPYRPNPVSEILDTLEEFRRGGSNKYKMVIVVQRKRFRRLHYCGYNMSDDAIAELKSQLEGLGWKKGQ